MISFEAWCDCKGTGVQAVPLQGETIYAICQFCDGVGTITIQEEDMEEQESKQPFTYEEELPKRFEELQLELEKVKSEVWKNRSTCTTIRDKVRNFFQERYTDNDYPDDLTFDIDEINDLLDSIDASALSKRYEATATVDITFKVFADDRDDAESIINDYLSDLSIYVNGEDDYEVDSIDIHVAE